MIWSVTASWKSLVHLHEAFVLTNPDRWLYTRLLTYFVRRDFVLAALFL
jgi:hypothetical protein